MTERNNFSERDRNILEATSESTWVPPNPRDLLLPYIEKEDTVQGETELERRQRKTIEVMDGYNKIIQDCQEARAKIVERCKNVSVPIDEINNPAVLEAVRRLFRKDAKEITFDMYVQVVHALAEVGNDEVPRLI